MLSSRKKLIFGFALVLVLISLMEENISNDFKDKWERARFLSRVSDIGSMVSAVNKSISSLSLRKEYSFNPPIFIKNITATSTNNVFLLETGSHEEFSPNFRLLSSIESWSRSNPDCKVWFLVNSSRVLDEDGLLRKLLQKYRNLRIALLHPDAVLKSTPLISVFNGKFKECEWKAAHLSDFLRLALLWKFGGFYSDTDTVCIRSVSHLHNVVGLTNDRLINSAVCHFEKGHPLTWTIMEMILNDYDALDYFSVIKSVGGVVKKACNVSRRKQLKTLPGSDQCKGVSVMPSEAFFPLNGRGDSKLYFAAEMANTFNETFGRSYVLHLAYTWSTQTEIVRLGQRTLYEKAVELYSPITYKAIAARSNDF